jgi:hypothetical protein
VVILARIPDARDGDTMGVDAPGGRLRVLAARLGWASDPVGTHHVVENGTSAFKRERFTLPGGRRSGRRWPGWPMAGRTALWPGAWAGRSAIRVTWRT